MNSRPSLSLHNLSNPALEEAAPASVFDSANLLSRFDNDRDMAKIITDIFLEGIDAALSELKSVVATRNDQTVAMQAHGLKGAALNCGAGTVAEISRRLESLARNGSLDGAEQLLTNLEQEVDRYKYELQQLGWGQDREVL